MRIGCPNCDAAYDVPPDRVTPGRSVRCARCSTTWAPVPPLPSPDPQLPPDSAPTLSPSPKITPPFFPVDVPASIAAGSLEPAPAEPLPRVAAGVAPASRLVSRLLLVGAWLFSLALLTGLGWASVTHRDSVVRAWPPSERAYLALGLGQHPAAPTPTQTPAPAH